VLGYVLLIINLILTVSSFLCALSAIQFASGLTTTQFNFNVSYDPTVPSISIGSYNIQNTGIFDLGNLTWNVDLYYNTNNSNVINYTSYIPDHLVNVTAGQSYDLLLAVNGTGLNTVALSSLFANPATFADINGTVGLSGNYVFGLFTFSISVPWTTFESYFINGTV
jgi:hypothetical protein